MASGLMLVVSSCGGGGSGQLSKSEYESKIGAILQPLQGPTLQKLVTISPGDRDRAVRALKDGESKLHAAASELESMKPPDDAVEPTRLLAKGVREIADQVTTVRKDAERGDFARLIRFKVSLASDPAVGEIRDAAVQLINLGYNITGGSP
jgi:HEAT repeat protein